MNHQRTTEQKFSLVNRLKHLVLAGFVTLNSIAVAAEPAATHSNSEPQKEMNGLKLSDFAGFEKSWRLVTVRFRKDTNEMRWTFANDSAWKTLAAGSIEYPDGAVFAKIGAVTNEDSQFPSSAVPSGARRFQFMVKDKKKYKSTGGWGYALFDIDGNLFPEPVAQATQACYACHQIVTNRGQVFSQPFMFLSGSKAIIETTFLSDKKGFRKIQFETAALSSLPGAFRESVQTSLTPDLKSIRMISNESLRKNIFQGTLDEIRPTLETEAHRAQLPAALISIDGKQFSVVMPIDKDGCKKGRAYRFVSTTTNFSQSETKAAEFPKTRNVETCNP